MSKKLTREQKHRITEIIAQLADVENELQNACDADTRADAADSLADAVMQAEDVLSAIQELRDEADS